MEDIQKQHFFTLTPHVILDAVEELGYRCTGRCLALNSMENRVFEVEIETAQEVTNRWERFKIAKFYRPGRWSEAQILEEHRFLLDLQENELPVVAPIVYEDNRTLFTIEESGIRYAVFPKAGGRNPQELDHEQLAWLGRLLARMHTVGARSAASHRLSIDPATYGTANLEYLLSSNALPHEIRSEYQQSVERLVELTTPWFSEASTHRIHGDCHLGNIVWGDDGPFLLDFDDMVNGPAVQDLWLVIPGRDDDAKRQLDSLLTGYEQMRHFDDRTLRLIEPLRAFRFIHFSSWIARRWDDPSFRLAFSHFGTPAYWREQLGDLRDQLDFIERGRLWE